MNRTKKQATWSILWTLLSILLIPALANAAIITDWDDDGVTDTNEILQGSNPYEPMDSVKYAKRALDLSKITATGVAVPVTAGEVRFDDASTVEFWLLPYTDGTTTATIFENGTDAEVFNYNAGEVVIKLAKVDDATVRFDVVQNGFVVGSTDAFSADPIAVPTDTDWQHIALTTDGTGNFTLYWTANQYDGTDPALTWFSADPFTADGAVVLGKGFNRGFMDEFRFFQSERSATALLSKSDRACSKASDPDLSLYYRFDDGGKTAEDFAHLPDFATMAGLYTDDTAPEVVDAFKYRLVMPTFADVNGDGHADWVTAQACAMEDILISADGDGDGIINDLVANTEDNIVDYAIVRNPESAYMETAAVVAPDQYFADGAFGDTYSTSALYIKAGSGSPEAIVTGVAGGDLAVTRYTLTRAFAAGEDNYWDGIDNDSDGIIDDTAIALSFDGGVIPLEDSDGDGMPDAWEVLYFGDITSSDGTGDSDGDGVNDLNEYLMGLNPTLKVTPSRFFYAKLSDGRYAYVEQLDTDPVKFLLDGNEADVVDLEKVAAMTDGEIDFDGDSISNYDEIHTYGTNPVLKDTDADGLDDNVEILVTLSDPNDALSPASKGLRVLDLVLKEHEVTVMNPSTGELDYTYTTPARTAPFATFFDFSKSESYVKRTDGKYDYTCSITDNGVITNSTAIVTEAEMHLAVDNNGFTKDGDTYSRYYRDFSKITDPQNITIDMWFNLDDESATTGTLLQKTAFQADGFKFFQDFRLWLNEGKLVLTYNTVSTDSITPGNLVKNAVYTKDTFGPGDGWTHVIANMTQVTTGGSYTYEINFASQKGEDAIKSESFKNQIGLLRPAAGTDPTSTASLPGELVVGDTADATERLSMTVDQVSIWSDPSAIPATETRFGDDAIKGDTNVAIDFFADFNQESQLIFWCQGTQMVATGALREEALTVLDMDGSLEDFDTDGDGIADAWEILWFGDLTTANATTDNDGDGLTDYQEYMLRDYGYIPTNTVSVPRSYYATVNDEYIFVTQQADGTFVKYGTTEVVVPDDADELKLATDGEVDFDGDYLSNADENREYGSDPLKADTDGDGLDDWEEAMLNTDPADGQDPWRNRVLDLVKPDHDVIKLVYDEASNTYKEETVAFGADRTAPYAVVEDFNGMITDLTAWSAEFWFNLSEVTDGVILQKTADAGKQDFKLELQGGNFVLTLNDTLAKDKNPSFTFSDFTVTENTWTHFAFTVDQAGDKNYKIFMMAYDGADEYTAEFTNNGKLRTTAASKDGDLVIGDPDGNLSVQIDELRIWNKVVSQEDFATNREFMLDADTTGMAAYFQFNYKNLSGDTVSALTYTTLSNLYENVIKATNRYNNAQNAYATAYNAVYNADGSEKSGVTQEQKDALTAAQASLNTARSEYYAALTAYSDEYYSDGLVAVMMNDADLSIVCPDEYLTGDSDGDGIADWWEMNYFGGLYVADEYSDYDEDGLSDLGEYQLFSQGADPTDPYSLNGVDLDGDVDSDGDGLLNRDEVAYGTNPAEVDTDGDTFSDWEEIMANSDPTDNGDPWFNRSLDLISVAHDVKAYQYNDTTGKIEEAGDVNMPARVAPYAIIKDFDGMIYDLSAWSGEFWFNLYEDATDGDLLQKTAENPAKADFWFGLKNGNLTLVINDKLTADKKQTYALEDFTVPSGEWIHAAFHVEQTEANKYTLMIMAYDAATGKTYSDNKEFTGAVITESQPGDLVIGDTTGALSVQIDELRIWNKIVSPNEFEASRDIFLSAETAKLAAYFNFNATIADGTGTAAVTYATRSYLTEQLRNAANYLNRARDAYYQAYDAVYDNEGKERSGVTDEQKENLANARAILDYANSNYNTILAAYEKEMASDGMVAKFKPAAPDTAYLSITVSEEYQDGDSDGDGIADWWEYTYFGDLNTADSVSDNDSDNLSDYYEYLLRGEGADPTDPYSLTGDNKTLDGDVDSDGDGLTNAEELLYSTNPLNVDTDDDGVSDKIEVALCANPTHPMSVVVTKADGETLTGKTWNDIKDTDLTLYRATNAPSRSLNLAALSDRINLPYADRFAVGARMAADYNKTYSGDFTVELWLKAESGSESGIIFETKAADTDFGWRFQLVNGIPEGEIFTTAGGSEQVLAVVGGEGATPALQADAWTYLALNWNSDAKTLNMYRDKIAMIGSLPVTYEIDFGSASEYAFIENISGVAIDEFRFWGETRSAEQVEYWSEKIIPSPLNAIISYNLIDGNEERFMTRPYELRAYYRFDDGGESVEDFAHFQQGDYALTGMGSAIIGLDEGAKEMFGTDDVDGDGIPEWWMNIWNLNSFYNATENVPSGYLVEVPGAQYTFEGSPNWTDMLMYDDQGNIVGLYGYTFGVGYTSLGGDSGYTVEYRNGWPIRISHTLSFTEVATGDPEGAFVTDNFQLSYDMAYVTMHKYIALNTKPVTAYLNTYTHLGANVIGVIVNQHLLEGYGPNTNIAEYLQAGRNQIVVVWSRSVFKSVKVTVGGGGGEGDKGKEYTHNLYEGTLDVDMTVDGNLVIAKGHDYRYDPRAVWYYRATTQDYNVNDMVRSVGNRSVDSNGYTLNPDINSTNLDAYAFNYGAIFDKDGDGLDLYSEYLIGTNPSSKDSDNNGIFDGKEDYDEDGIVNDIEINSLFTDALCADADNDGVSDSKERATGSDPTDWNSPTNYLFLDVDGSDGCYAQLPLQSRFALDTFTIEAMVLPMSDTPEGLIVQRVVGTVDETKPLVNYELGLTEDGKPYMSFSDKDGSKARRTLTGSDAIPFGADNETWTHLAMSFDAATNLMTLYVDGVQVAKGMAASQPITSGPALVYTRMGEGFNGGIDEVRFWNDVRTSAEIQANMDQALEGTEENLVAYYRFDDVTDGRDPASLTAKYCADSAIGSAFDWRNNWANVAVLCGTAVVSQDPEHSNDFSVAIYAYSNGIEEGDEDPEYAYLAPTGSELQDDILQAVIQSYPASAATESLTYKSFWLKTDATGYTVGDLSYSSDVLYDVVTGAALSSDIVLGTGSELDLADLDLAVGDYIQLVVAAVSEDGVTSILSVSDTIEMAYADDDHTIPAALILVDPTEDVTGLAEGKALNVKVKNDNAFGGVAHITWYRNMVPAKTDAVTIAANAEATLKMEDTAKVVEGDVWSFKVWFEREGSTARSRSIPVAETPAGTKTTEWVFMMIGEGYDEDVDGSGKTEYGAPTKPTSCFITPSNPDPQSILTVSANGSKCKYPFNYYYQWYYKATTSANYVLAVGQDLPYWQPAIAAIADDMGITQAGFSTYVLDPGDQVYCSVYAMNIYGEKSAAVIANSEYGTRLTIADDVTGTYYEPNDEYLTAHPIYAKTTWMDEADPNIQVHTFRDRDDQDWVWFVVPASTDSRRMLVSFETNSGVMFRSGDNIPEPAPDTQFSLYKKGADGKPQHIESYTQYTADDHSGSYTGFARFVNKPLDPGIYYIQVTVQDRNVSSTVLSAAPYYLHLYMEYEPWTGEGITWDTPADGKQIVELTPEEPSGNDNLVVKMNAYAYDNNDEKILDYRYLWYRNGVVVPLSGVSSVESYTTSQYLLDQAVSSYTLNGKTVPGNTILADMTQEGDVWYCEVYPYTKALGWGEGVITNPVAVGSCKWSMTLTTRKSFVSGPADDPVPPAEPPAEEQQQAEGGEETPEDEDLRGGVNPGDEVVILGWDEFATFGFDASYDAAFPSLTIPSGDGTYKRQALAHGCLYSFGLTNDYPYLAEDYRPYGKTGTWFVIAEMGDPKEDTITEFALCWDPVNMPSSNASDITITQMTKRVDGYYETVLGTTTTVVPGEAGEIVLDSAKLANLQVDENGQKFAIFRITIGSPDMMQQITLQQGWNLVALPMTPLYSDVNDIFSVNGSKVYSGSIWQYEGGRYIAASNVVATKGYWLFAKSPVTLQVYGTAEADVISLSEGWNIVGPVVDIDDFVGTYNTLYPTAYDKIAKNNTGDPELYKFVDGEYGLATDSSGKYIMKVGQGYWIKATEAVDLPVVK